MGDRRRFEHPGGKYWEVWTDGPTLWSESGRTGAAGTSRRESCDTPADAAHELARLVRRWSGEGYVEARAAVHARGGASKGRESGAPRAGASGTRKRPKQTPSAEDEATTRAARGAQLLNRGDNEGGVRELEAARAACVDDDLRATILDNLSTGYQRLSRYDEMRGVTTELVALVGDHDDRAWATHAIPLQHLGRLDEALTAVDRALQGDPDDTFALWEKACILVARGDREAALSCLERVLSIDADQREGIAADDDFAALRDDPRFRKLCAKSED